MHFHLSEPATDPGGTLRRGRVVNCGMRSRLVTLGSFCLAFLASGLAAAQTPAPAGSTASPPGTAAPAPSAVPLPDSPPPVVVDDPMLTPVPPPLHVITTWEDATRMMRARSTDLRRAHDDVLKAEADSRTALGAVLPTLSATGTASHTILPTASSGGGSVIDTGTPAGAQAVSGAGGGRNSLTGSLRLAVPLIDFKGWHNVGTARVNEEVARLSYADLERTTAAALASAIADNVTAERLAEIGRLGLRNALERQALAEAKERTGTGTGLDIVRAKQDVAVARSALVDNDESLRRSRDALGLAVGLTEPVGVTPATDLAAIRTGVLKSCRQLPELEERADLRATEKVIEIARRRAVEVDQGFLPTLAAGSTFTESVSDSGAPARTSWNIQAVLSIPIFDGGVKYGQRRSAQAVADQTDAAREGLRRESTVSIVQARRAVGVAEQSRTVSEDRRRLAYDVDRMTRTAYQTGKGTSLELVASATALRQAEVDLAVDELALVRARIASLLTLADCSVAK
jgi:multidrug efflux system outer membrane protein